VTPIRGAQAGRAWVLRPRAAGVRPPSPRICTITSAAVQPHSAPSSSRFASSAIVTPDRLCTCANTSCARPPLPRGHPDASPESRPGRLASLGGVCAVCCARVPMPSSARQTPYGPARARRSTAQARAVASLGLLRSSLDTSAIRPRVAIVATRYPGARIARHRRPGLAASRAVNGQSGRSNCPNSRERHANSVKRGHQAPLRHSTDLQAERAISRLLTYRFTRERSLVRNQPCPSGASRGNRVHQTEKCC